MYVTLVFGSLMLAMSALRQYQRDSMDAYLFSRELAIRLYVPMVPR